MAGINALAGKMSRLSVVSLLLQQNTATPILDSG